MLGADPIKCKKLIHTIANDLKILLGELYTDIFKLGLQLGLRGGDLLAIQQSNINFETNILTIKEQKTGKIRKIKLNLKAQTVINKRIHQYPNDPYLFMAKSNRASKTKPISLQAVNDAFKKIGSDYNLKLTTHTLRKTFGYFAHKQGVALSTLASLFNHSSTTETLKYIGITQETIFDVYENIDI